MSVLALPHIGFVIAAYAVALVVVGGLIGAVAIDYRAQRRALAAQGRATGDDGAIS